LAGFFPPRPCRAAPVPPLYPRLAADPATAPEPCPGQQRQDCAAAHSISAEGCRADADPPPPACSGRRACHAPGTLASDPGAAAPPPPPAGSAGPALRPPRIDPETPAAAAPQA